MKTRSAFDVMEQTGGGFYREEECKIPMLVSSASNQVHFKVFLIFKGSSKPNPIETIRQSLFSVWDYTFSLRLKVMKVTELAVCKILVTSETFEKARKYKAKTNPNQ